MVREWICWCFQEKSAIFYFIVGEWDKPDDKKGKLEIFL